MDAIPIVVTPESVIRAGEELNFRYLFTLLDLTHRGFARARYISEKSCRRGAENRAEHYAIVLRGLLERNNDEVRA